MDSLVEAIKHFVFLVEEWLDPNRERVLRVHGRCFRIVRKLGEGGFAFVHLVRDVKSGQQFALKRIRLPLEEQLAKFDREVKAHQAVHHPNVIRLVDHAIFTNRKGTREGLLLLPLYRNGSVQDLVEKVERTRQPLPLTTVMKIFTSTCEGLRGFHERHPALAFRDLKPANILLDHNGTAVLTDLGSVAPARVEVTSRREALQLEEIAAETCTAPYRAPELFSVPSNCVVDERTDIWSLGCVLFALCYGRAPFEGTETSAMGTIPFPDVSNFPHSMVELIRSLIVIDPQQRPRIDRVQTMARELGLV